MRTTHRARALVLGAASALLLFGSGCVIREYRPDDVAYAQPQPQAAHYYAYYGGHVIPERYGGGWCFIQGLHYHVYPPDYAEYYQDDDGYYSYQGPVSFYFYGPHPIPAADGGGWCYRHGRHVHHYHPGYNLGWHYQPTYRYYYWDPNRRDADDGRYHPAEPAYRRTHPVYVTPGHPVNGGGTYAGHPARPGTGTPVYGHPANGGNGGPVYGHPVNGGNGGPVYGHPVNGGNGGPVYGHPVNGGSGGPVYGQPGNGGSGSRGHPVNGGSGGNGGFRPADPGIGNGHPVPGSPGSVDLGPIEGSGQPGRGHPANGGNGGPTFHPVNPGRPQAPSQPSYHPVNPGRPQAPSGPTFHPVNPGRPQAPSGPSSGGGYRPGPVVRPPVTRPVTRPVGGGTGSRGGHGFVPEKARKARDGARERSTNRGHAAHPARPEKKKHER